MASRGAPRPAAMAALFGAVASLAGAPGLADAAPVLSGPLEASADGAGTLRFRQTGGVSLRQAPGSLRFLSPGGWQAATRLLATRRAGRGPS